MQTDFVVTLSIISVLFQPTGHVTLCVQDTRRFNTKQTILKHLFLCIRMNLNFTPPPPSLHDKIAATSSCNAMCLWGAKSS